MKTMGKSGETWRNLKTCQNLTKFVKTCQNLSKLLLIFDFDKKYISEFF